jgi:hypothetical protein
VSAEFFGSFVGHSGRDCGEHRSVGTHRAWCLECNEWCYPEDGACRGCEQPQLRIELAAKNSEIEQASNRVRYWERRWTAAVERGDRDAVRIIKLRSDLAVARERIDAALALHLPAPWYRECMDHKPDDPNYGETHFGVGQDWAFTTCEANRLPDVCAACTPDGADDDERHSVRHPCATVRALTGEEGR